MAPSILLDFDTITALWVFGDAHDVPLLQNAVADIYVEKVLWHKHVPTREDIEVVFNNTTVNAQLRRLLIDSIRSLPGTEVTAWDWDGQDDAYTVERLDHAVKHVVSIGPKWQRPGSIGWLKPCEYHVHEPGASCLEAEAKRKDDSQFRNGLDRGFS